MATAKRIGAGTRQPSSWRRNALLITAALLLALMTLVGVHWLGAARADVAIAARLGCVCRFVSQRDLQACQADLGDDVGLVTLGEDKERRAITASYLLLRSETATYDPARGCQLPPWER